MINRTKKGFSLIEVMLLFTVLAVLMAASLPVITKKSRPVPRKFSHGVYVCYANGNQLYQELYTGTRLSEPAKPVSACNFSVPEAALYKIDLYSAGAGGNLAAKIVTGLDDYRSAVYSLKDANFGHLYQYKAANFDSTATENDKASPLHQLTDDDLAEFFKNDYIIKSEYTNNAGYGPKGTLDYFYPRGSRCLAQAHLLQAVDQKIVATNNLKNSEKANLGNTSGYYGNVLRDINEYRAAFSSYLSDSGSGKTDALKRDMLELYSQVKNYNTKSYNDIINKNNYGSAGEYYDDFKDIIEPFNSTLKKNFDGRYEDLSNRLGDIKGHALADASQEYAKAKANQQIEKEARAQAKADTNGYDALTFTQMYKDLWAKSQIENDPDAIKRAKKYANEVAGVYKYYNPKASQAEVDAIYQENYDKWMNEHELTAENVKDKWQSAEKKYNLLYGQYVTKYTNDHYDQYYQAALAEFTSQASGDKLTTYKTAIASAYETLKTEWQRDKYPIAYINHLIKYDPNADSVAGVIGMRNNNDYDWEYEQFYRHADRNYYKTKNAVSNRIIAKYVGAASDESIRNCLLNKTSCTSEYIYRKGVSQTTISDLNAMGVNVTKMKDAIDENMQLLENKKIKPVKSKLNEWKTSAADIAASGTGTQIQKEIAVPKELLFANQTFSDYTPTITEDNWYGTKANPGWVKKAEDYYDERKGAFSTEQTEKDEYWQKTLDDLNTNLSEIRQGSLDKLLKDVPLYLSDKYAFDLRNPDSTHPNNMPIETDSNTYDQLKAYCRANNIKMFMNIYQDSTIKPLVPEVEKEYRLQNNISSNISLDSEQSADVYQMAFKAFLDKKIDDSAATAQDTVLGVDYNYQGKTYGDVLQDYWNNPIQYALKSSDNQIYKSSLSTGYGGTGGMGGYLRIKYPVAYMSKWTKDSGETIEAEYSGIEGGVARTMSQYLNAMNNSLSPEGRFPVKCDKNIPFSNGYYEYDALSGDTAIVNAYGNGFCYPYGSHSGAHGLIGSLTYDDDFDAKQQYITMSNGEKVLRDVSADYYKDAHRTGNSKKFLDKEGTKRYLKTYKGIDLKELDYPYIAWHIPVHGDPTNPYKITKHRIVSLVKGLDNLATGGGNKLIYMDEEHLKSIKDALPAKSDAMLAKFYNDGYKIKDNATEIMNFNNTYQTLADVSNAMLKVERSNGVKIGNDVAFSVREPKPADGQNTKFEQINYLEHGTFPSYRTKETWIQGKDFYTTITAVTAHTDDEKNKVLTTVEAGNKAGMIAYQDPQLREFSKIWSKQYFVGKSGRPGKLESTVATNLGKFCIIDVPHGGKPYDITEEEGYNAKYNPNPIPKPKLKEMEDALAINMACGKNWQEVKDGKNIVYKRTVKGGTYNVNLTEEPKFFHWSSKYDTAEVGKGSAMNQEANGYITISGENYEGSKDNGSNVINRQPTWKPTSIWAKIFRKMVADDAFAPSKYGVGYGGNGTAISDRCIVRKGEYQTQKQYERKRFVANTVEISKTLQTGETVATDVAISNYPIKIPNYPEYEVENTKNGKYKYNGKAYFQKPDGSGKTIDCYFAKDTDDGTDYITTNLTSKSEEVEYGAYDMSAGPGGGGAVIISW